MRSTESLSGATLAQLIELNPALGQRTIRVDQQTQKGSVIDVIRLITGLSSAHAGQSFSRLGAELVASNICNIRINGKGKLTPVADAATLQMIVHLLPGKRFSSSRAKSLVHASTLKRKFSVLLETGKMELKTEQKKSIKLELKRASVSDETCTIEYDYMAGLKPSALEAMNMADIIFPDDQPAPGGPPVTKDGVAYFLRLEGTPFV